MIYSDRVLLRQGSPRYFPHPGSNTSHRQNEMSKYSIRLNGVKCDALYFVSRSDGEGEVARARTQHLRVFHKPRFYHSAEYCT